MKFVVTTPLSANSISETMAQFIRASEFEYVPRTHGSLAKIAADYDADGVIVWEKTGPILYRETEKLFFHPNMAKARIAAYRKIKQADIMIKACALERGDSFLDCTLGMGADSIVAAYFSETGKITGLESQAVIAHIMGWGMRMYNGNMKWLNEAIGRVEVINCDHKAYLARQADCSYDIVYFDPMFINPIMHSQPISPLRELANNNPLSSQVVEDACRVAKKRVVLKTRNTDGEIERLGFTRVPGSKHNPINYGVKELP